MLCALSHAVRLPLFARLFGGAEGLEGLAVVTRAARTNLRESKRADVRARSGTVCTVPYRDSRTELPAIA